MEESTNVILLQMHAQVRQNRTQPKSKWTQISRFESQKRHERKQLQTNFLLFESY